MSIKKEIRIVLNDISSSYSSGCKSDNAAIHTPKSGHQHRCFARPLPLCLSFLFAQPFSLQNLVQNKSNHLHLSAGKKKKHYDGENSQDLLSNSEYSQLTAELC